MTTAQLVVIWYATLFITAILFFQEHSYSPWYSVAAVVILASTILFTLRHHPLARKGWLLFWVGCPFIAVGVSIAGWYGYQAYKDWRLTWLVPYEKVGLTNLTLHNGTKTVRVWTPNNMCSEPVSANDRFVVKDYELWRLEDEGQAFITGCVENQSSAALKQFDLELMVGNKRLPIQVALEVMPGQAKQFVRAIDARLDRAIKQSDIRSYQVIGTRAMAVD